MKDFKIKFKGRNRDLQGYLERLTKKGFKRIDNGDFIIFSDSVRTISLFKNDLVMEKVRPRVDLSVQFEVKE